MQPGAKSNRRNDTKTYPVDDEESIFTDEFHVHLMLSGDVPKREKGDEENRHQCNGLLVVQKTSSVQMEQRRDLKNAILYCEDRMGP